jgi:hypothetical protein
VIALFGLYWDKGKYERVVRMDKRKVTLDDVATGKARKKRWGCANVIATILVGIFLTFFGLSVLSSIVSPDDAPAVPTLVAFPSETLSPAPTDMINTTTSESEDDMDIQSALDSIQIESITVTQAQNFEISQTTIIQFTMPNNGDIGKAFIREALCLARPFVPDGYRLRIAGNNAADMGLLVVGISADSLATLPCPFEGELSEIAESYSEATGLR